MQFHSLRSLPHVQLLRKKNVPFSFRANSRVLDLLQQPRVCAVHATCSTMYCTGIIHRPCMSLCAENSCPGLYMGAAESAETQPSGLCVSLCGHSSEDRGGLFYRNFFISEPIGYRLTTILPLGARANFSGHPV